MRISSIEYEPRQNVNYTAEDVFWGELGGCLEAIDAGTSTLMDHAHMNFTADHCKRSKCRCGYPVGI